jgi:hypothetical protein
MLKQMLENKITDLLDLLYYGNGVEDVQDYGKLGIMVELGDTSFSDITEFLTKVENNFKVKSHLITSDEIIELSKLSHIDYQSNYKDILKEEKLFLIS